MIFCPWLIFGKQQASGGGSLVGGSSSSSYSLSRRWGRGGSARDILVLYIFSNDDPEYLSNLRFFVAEAVAKDRHSEFFILVTKEGTQVRRGRGPGARGQVQGPRPR